MAINKIDLGQVVPDIDMSEYATKAELSKKMGMGDKVIGAWATASTQDMCKRIYSRRYFIRKQQIYF